MVSREAANAGFAGMTNIPTDLLRTFVSVVDLRSFTRAAQVQGVTQPAVSAQVKRLQSLLATDLLDKSSPGVCLTPAGEIVVSQARRLLAINDQIFTLTGPHPSERVLRVGVPRDAIRPELARVLARFRARAPEVRFILKAEPYDVLMRELRHGEFDLVFAMSIGGTNSEARIRWAEQMVWIRGADFELDPERPIPLIAFSRDCGSHRAAVDALEKASRKYELVFESANVACLNEAVCAGLGIMAGPRGRMPQGLTAWLDAPLPALAEALCGVYTREDDDTPLIEDLARALAELYGPRQSTDPVPGRDSASPPALPLAAAAPSL
jgi:DNA-binding transcriptional LysR family regulator